MASDALPPGFPAIELDGEHYRDGGLISNTPPQYVIAYVSRRKITVTLRHPELASPSMCRHLVSGIAQFE